MVAVAACGGHHSICRAVQISVLCRNPEQAAAAATVEWVDEITLDFLGTQGLKATLEDIRRAGKRACLALPRISKPGEQGVWKFFMGLQPDALLLRSAGMLHTLQKHLHEQERSSSASEPRATNAKGSSRRRSERPAAPVAPADVPPVTTEDASGHKASEGTASESQFEAPLIPGRRPSRHKVQGHSSVSEPEPQPAQGQSKSQGEVRGESSQQAPPGVREAVPGVMSVNEADAEALAEASAARERVEAFKMPRKAAAVATRKFPELHGDFSLNAANSLSAATLLGAGLSRLTLTHDLNADQMADLALNLPEALTHRLEVVLHQHLPIFHTEHCVFCRFLSDGNSKDDCGHPCEQHSVHLRDAAGKDHLVLADMGCRNTVFNAEAQSGLPHAVKLQRAGFRCDASACRHTT